MTAPMVRGTARRLGLRRPLRPGEYYAPLPAGWSTYDETQLWQELDPDAVKKLHQAAKRAGWSLETSTVDQAVVEP